MQDYILDRYGRRIGFTDIRGDKKYAKDITGKILGWYESKTNSSYDNYGRYLGKGDLTVSLIWQDYNAKIQKK